MKRLAAVFLVILLCSCGTGADGTRENPKPDAMIKKTLPARFTSCPIRFKIVDGEKYKHYLVTLSSSGKVTENAAVLPMVQSTMTNEDQEVTMKLACGVDYHVTISDVKAKNMEELMAGKRKGADLVGSALENFNFTPKKESQTVFVRLYNKSAAGRSEP
jgi:hypothetical protein